MIKYLYRSKSDIENLSRLRTSMPNGIDSFDYRGVVVNKPWGYEYLMFDNPHVAVWILHLRYGHKTSMHCHPNKKTSLIVLSGNVVCSTLEGWLERRAGEGVIIDEAVFHSTKAVSDAGAMIMEVESPPNKKDLVRLKDEYGRELQEYEGTSSMSRELHKYEYIDFLRKKILRKVTQKLRNCQVSICLHKNSKNIHERLKREQAHLLCILQGKLHDHDGNIILATGETAAVRELRKTSRIYSFSDIMYLTIRYYGRKS